MQLKTLIFSGTLVLAPVAGVGCSSDNGPQGGSGGSGGSASGGSGGALGGSGGSPAGGSGGGAGTGGSAGSGGSGGSSSDAPVGDTSGGDSGDAPGSDAPKDAGGDAGGETGGGTALSFFVTSRGLGKGGDLGGLAGADAHCLALAKAVGSTKTKWAAYLSAAGAGTPVHARTRIGTGPWYNAKGVMIASSVENLHAAGGTMNALNEANSLDETGKIVPGRTEATRPAGTMNEHDIITGSTIEGMLAVDSTCLDWTSSSATASKAQVGHSDKLGPSPGMREEWNAAHTSGGCAEGRAAGGIGSGGGRGSFYCFAAD